METETKVNAYEHKQKEPVFGIRIKLIGSFMILILLNLIFAFSSITVLETIGQKQAQIRDRALPDLSDAVTLKTIVQNLIQIQDIVDSRSKPSDEIQHLIGEYHVQYEQTAGLTALDENIMQAMDSLFQLTHQYLQQASQLQALSQISSDQEQEIALLLKSIEQDAVNIFDLTNRDSKAVITLVSIDADLKKYTSGTLERLNGLSTISLGTMKWSLDVINAANSVSKAIQNLKLLTKVEEIELASKRLNGLFRNLRAVYRDALVDAHEAVIQQSYQKLKPHLALRAENSVGKRKLRIASAQHNRSELIEKITQLSSDVSTLIVHYYDGKSVNVSDSVVEMAENITQTKHVVYLVSLISFVLAVLLMVYMNYGIIKRIVNLAELSRSISEGGGDLTQRLKIQNQDELAYLAHYINLFIEKVQKIVQEISYDAHVLASSSEELSSSSTEIKYTSRSITQAINDEADAVQNSSTTISSLIESQGKMFEKIKTVQFSANEAGQIASYGNEIVVLTNNTMTKIETHTKKIEGVIQVITEIARKTNLLAVNATIEAAKAGNMGRGLSVVADEVRHLAERSKESVIEIKKLVDENNNYVQEGVKVIKETEDILSRIIEYVIHISEDLNQVSKEISSQEQGFHSVSKQVHSISCLSDSNSSSIRQMDVALSETVRTINDLSVLAETINQKLHLFKVE